MKEYARSLVNRFNRKPSSLVGNTPKLDELELKNSLELLGEKLKHKSNQYGECGKGLADTTWGERLKDGPYVK